MSETPANVTPEAHEFRAEIRQLLDLVVHSLYTDKEIFLRELVSNASDAMEKLRHLEATEKTIHDAGQALEIHLTANNADGELTINDRGCGMTHDELVENLGTIAHSGTRKFLQALKDTGKPPGELIGQFGVGFYSAFMVADKVTVRTRSWRQDAEPLEWISDGRGGYTITPAPADTPRGTSITLHLQPDQKEYADAARIRHLIETYSNFVGFPILLDGTRVNEVEALWLKNKADITDEQYRAFYQFACRAFDDPCYRLHFSTDAPIAINALVFVPTENPERLGLAKCDPGVALYSRKVMIDPQPNGLLPEWMRFIRGVVDSPDIPLNISRESMQDSALVRKIGSVIAKRIIRTLEKEAEGDPTKYRSFYRNFERFIKEGVASDFTNREALARLMRFESSLADPGEPCGFADYVGRMKEGQDAIYFLVGQSREHIESSPYLEAFKARGLEVAYFTDGIDEYVLESLGTFDGRKLTSIRHGGVDLNDADTAGDALPDEETTALCAFLKDLLGDRVTRVDKGNRLVDSPVIALVPQDGMSPQMRQMMRAMDENFKDEVKVELEINPRHPLIHKLAATRSANPELASLVAGQLCDNALIAAGLLDDARDTVKRMNALMEQAMR
jgi:molecular chaperone HtpG